MLLKIKWTPRAKKDYLKIIDYLHEKWTIKEVNSFVIKTNYTLALISKNPNLFPQSKKKEIHKCVLSKQTSLYYRIRNSELELIAFWDNRRNPKKLKL